MRTLLIAVVALGFVLAIQGVASAQTGKKILVAYFSWSGNAKALAEQVAAETGGDLFEIKTLRPYPDNYEDCIDVAKKEQNNAARPELEKNVSGLDRYGTVFLAYPNWWGTLPMVVFTFLESNDFSGKTIYPLVTHGGSRFGTSLNDLKRICPTASVGEGLAVSAFDRNPGNSTVVSIPNANVTKWLSGLKLDN
ncbi:MAG: flavodoxin [Deltaproteobacteria bacterium]|nr:flavodoxin [Deltaproteobacteria bacterium]